MHKQTTRPSPQRTSFLPWFRHPGLNDFLSESVWIRHEAHQDPRGQNYWSKLKCKNILPASVGLKRTGVPAWPPQKPFLDFLNLNTPPNISQTCIPQGNKKKVRIHKELVQSNSFMLSPHPLNATLLILAPPHPKVVSLLFATSLFQSPGC